MRMLPLLSCVLGLAVFAGAGQSPGDIEKEIESLVKEYSRLEDAMDMESQFKLIADDRVWHGPAGRRTDNAMWMRVQQENFDNLRESFPGVKFHREVRDLHVRVIGGNAAVASFVWFTNRIVPMDLPADKLEMLGPSPPPLLVSLVWEKQGSSWKIVNSHFCFMDTGS